LAGTDTNGLLGVLTDNGDGTFEYDPAPGEEGVVTFDYTITDSDGDTSTATVTINLNPDSEPEIEVEPSVPYAGPGTSVVDEGALADGSTPDAAGTMTDGTFPFDTGNDTVGSLVINDVDVTNGGTVTGDFGTLVVTETGGDYTWVYTLDDNTDHPDGTSVDTPEGIQDVFDVVLPR